MGKPRSKKQIHQDIDNYVIVDEKIIGNVPAGKFKNTISFNGIIHPGTPMTINQLAALIAGLTTTVNDLSTTVTNQHNLVMGEIKAIKQDIVEIKHKLDEHDKKFELVFNILDSHTSILDSHTKIFARNNLK